MPDRLTDAHKEAMGRIKSWDHGFSDEEDEAFRKGVEVGFLAALSREDEGLREQQEAEGLAASDEDKLKPPVASREVESDGCDHKWGAWEDDVAGVIRTCERCFEIDMRPEG